MSVWNVNIRRFVKNTDVKPRYSLRNAGNVGKKMGCPDLLVMFTNTVSHKMMNTAVAEAKRKKC